MYTCTQSRTLGLVGIAARQMLVALLLAIAVLPIHAQTRLYDPEADASEELRSAVQQAAASGKHVLLQVGGNWCRWCVKLDSLMKRDARIDSILSADFVLLRLNYSKENRNLEVLGRLGNPQRFGFPVLLVLDGKGGVLHVQDSALLESGDGHDPEKVLRFLSSWTAGAVRWTPPDH